MVAELEKLFYMFGFPKKLHSDNGGEIKNKNMKNLCETHNIKLVHGAPRNPSTQGQVERNNSTVKVNITNVLKEKDLQSSHWCEVVHEATYKKNISLHRAIQKTPYYVVFGKEPNKECHDAKTNDQVPEENSTMEDQSTGVEQIELVNEQQTNGASYPDCTMELESTGAEQIELVNEQQTNGASYPDCTMELESTGAEQIELVNEQQTNGASYPDCTMELESTGAEQIELVNEQQTNGASYPDCTMELESTGAEQIELVNKQQTNGASYPD